MIGQSGYTLSTEAVIYATVIGLIIYIFFCIQRKIFEFAKRKVFKLTPIWILTALLAVGYIRRTVEIYRLRNVEFPYSATHDAIIAIAMLFKYFAILVLIAMTGCALGIAVEIAKNKIAKRKSALPKEHDANNNRADI